MRRKIRKLQLAKETLQPLVIDGRATVVGGRADTHTLPPTACAGEGTCTQGA